MGTLIYREQWTDSPPARPVTQKHVSHPDLTLSVYGAGGMGLKKSHHTDISDDPHYIWSGTCEGRWALALRHRRSLINLEDAGMVRWCCKQSGGHSLRLVVKSSDGPWLVSAQSAGESQDWRQFEFRPASLSWQMLDIDAVKILGEAPGACMGRVDAVGFTDLMAGGGTLACSRLAWIEVWGGEVARSLPLARQTG
jgi:hypothetical protein